MGDRSRGRLMKLGLMFGLLLLIIPSLAMAQTFSSKVSGVSAGDVITVFRGDKVQTVRLFGIACSKPDTSAARRAKEFSEKSVFGHMIEVEVVRENKKTGHIIGLVRFEGKLLNEELVGAGLAWVHPELCTQPVCEQWKALEARARAEKRGFWGDSAQHPPWDRKAPRR